MPFDLFPEITSPKQTDQNRAVPVGLAVECVMCDAQGQPVRRRVFSMSSLLKGLRLA